MKKILERLRFKWYFYKAEYAKALASLKKYPCANDELWACYMLGMHDTVANSLWDGYDIKAGFAIAASLSACGRFEEAEDIISKLTYHKNFENYRIRLAIAISYYMPSVAIEIVKDNAPLDFYISLLLQNRKNDKAKELLQRIIDKNEKVVSKPEFYLFAGNVIANSPLEQLRFLNSFFSSYGLDVVTLKDVDKPLSVTNLKSNFKRTVDAPLISVLVTAYNTSCYISSALESLLAQTYKNIEVVVVDDCSTDDTSNIIHKIASCDKRVKYYKLPCNLGTFAAKTIGFTYASGDFILCHDSDDWLHPQLIAIQMSTLLQNKKLVAAVSNWIRIDNDGVYRTCYNYPLLRLNPTSLLFRKKIVLEKMGLWDIVRTGADSEFYTRMKLVFGRKAVQRIKLPLTIGAYRENSLMVSVDTGNSPKGMSPIRLAYWEAWTRWHIDCLKEGKKPIMTRWSEANPKRPFVAPLSIDTSCDTIKRYLSK
ncbi:MAG: glycosyltransferase [Campylobacteraceae bacterium]|nr:glycosyltransferase [Campylobacteraceae bacterium]